MCLFGFVLFGLVRFEFKETPTMAIVYCVSDAAAAVDPGNLFISNDGKCVCGCM